MGVDGTRGEASACPLGAGVEFGAMAGEGGGGIELVAGVVLGGGFGVMVGVDDALLAAS